MAPHIFVTSISETEKPPKILSGTFHFLLPKIIQFSNQIKDDLLKLYELRAFFDNNYDNCGIKNHKDYGYLHPTLVLNSLNYNRLK